MPARMNDAPGHESIGETVEHVWNNNRPFALAFLALLAFVAYRFIKSNQANNANTQPAATSSPDASNMAGAYPGSISNTYSQTTLNYTGPAQPPIATQPLPTPTLPPVPGPNPPTPTPKPTTPNPLIPYGQWPKGIPWAWGQKVTVNGTVYTIGPGSNGLIWGVPNFSGNLAQWNAVPIGSGSGQKVAVYGPASAYH